jgi:glycosyltransferase involved in cell wall biosynthesis
MDRPLASDHAFIGIALEGSLMRILICNGGTHPELQWIAARCVELNHEVIYSTSFGVTISELAAAKSSSWLPAFAYDQMRRRALPAPIAPTHVRRSAVGREVLSVAALRKSYTGAHIRLIDSRNNAVDARSVRLARRFSPDAVVMQSLSGWRLPEYCADMRIPLTVNFALPTGPVVDHILNKEREANPTWARFLQGADTRDREERSSSAELAAATNAIAASTFTAESLKPLGYSGPVIHAPLGVPVRPHAEALASRASSLDPHRPKILFVGQISQRKGLSYLFEAMSMGLPGNPVLTLAGADFNGMTAKLRSTFPDVQANFTGPLSREALSKLYGSHTVFAFPSLTEGFGLALVEAMAHGMPAVATPNSAAPDLFDNGRAGLLVPAGDPVALHQTLSKALLNPDLCEAMGVAAAARAKSMTWDSFADQVASQL